MPSTHSSVFPSGFANGITVRGLPLQVAHPGEVFWVNNSSVLAKNGVGGADANPGTYHRPFNTIDYAIGRCTASRGDIIMVMPGHSETITTDGGIACDVAGIAIVGLGTGSLRAKVVFDHADAAITVSAANVTLKNLLFVGSIADCTNAIDCTSTWLTVEDCEFEEEGASLNFVDYIHCSSTTNNNADGLYVAGCRGTAIDTAQNSFVNVKADVDRLVFKDNFYSSTHANTLACILAATGKDLTDCIVRDNVVSAPGKTSGDVLVDTDTTANTGAVFDNKVGTIDTVGAVVADVDGAFAFANASAVSTTVGAPAALDPHPLLGYRVQKSATNIGAAGNVNLFTVAGGLCLVTRMEGEVTTVIESTTCNYRVFLATSTGADPDLASNVSINALAAGSHVLVEGDGTALIKVDAGFTHSVGGLGFTVAEGTITADNSASATGAFSWDLWYWPIDSGASIVAA